MTTDTASTQNSYDPNRLLDALKDMLRLDSDLALSHVLEVPPPVISQIRHRGYPVGPSILIRMHDVTSLSVRELRTIMGDRRQRIRGSYDMTFSSNPGTEEMRVGDDSKLRLIHLCSIVALVAGTFWYFIL